jgi:hypothetical protein
MNKEHRIKKRLDLYVTLEQELRDELETAFAPLPQEEADQLIEAELRDLEARNIAEVYQDRRCFLPDHPNATHNTDNNIQNTIANES